MIKRILLSLLFLPVLVACGGTLESPGGSANYSCTLHLSGVVGGDYNCSMVLVYERSSNSFIMQATATKDSSEPGDLYLFQFQMRTPGSGASGTYVSSSGTQTQIEAMSPQNNIWVVDSSVPTGGAQAVIDSLGISVTASTMDAEYYGSGHVAGSLEPKAGTGAHGEEMMYLSFNIPPMQTRNQSGGGVIGSLLQRIASQGGSAAYATPITFPTLIPILAGASPEAPTATPTEVVPTSTGSQAGADTACMITLSGAVAKQLPCTVSMVYSAKDGTTGLQIASVAHVTAVPEATLIVTLDGQPKSAPATFTWDNSARQVAMVYEGGIQAYNAASDSQKGASSLKLTSLTVQSTAADGGKVYLAHGSGQASLVGLSGSVSLSVTF